MRAYEARDIINEVLLNKYESIFTYIKDNAAEGKDFIKIKDKALISSCIDDYYVFSRFMESYGYSVEKTHRSELCIRIP